MRAFIPPREPAASASIQALERVLEEMKREASAVVQHREETLYQVGKRQLFEATTRASVFDPRGHLFGDPAWMIMLSLFVTLSEYQLFCVTDAVLASCAPPTTGLRYVTALINAGLIARRPDPRDRRRHFVELTKRGEELMQECLGKSTVC